MTYSTTSYLALQLPTPGSGERWSTSVYNANLQAILAKLQTVETLALANSASLATASGSFAQASGWTLNRGTLSKIGRLASCDISLNRTGGPITGPSSGDTTNLVIGTVPAAWKPKEQYAGLQEGPGGFEMAFTLQQNLNVYLTAIEAGQTINTGDEVTIAAAWATES